MSDVLFPKLPGLAWDVKRKPKFSTLVHTAANGLSVRAPLLTDPLWEFTCSFEFLRDDPAHDELNQLLGFFLARKGAYDSFLLDLSQLTNNPADAVVIDQNINLMAPNWASSLVRTLGAGGYDEVIYELGGRPVIKGNSIPVTENVEYRLYTPPQTAAGQLNANGITYGGWAIQAIAAIAPPVTADFGFYYRVRFAQDEQELNLFSQMLYEAQEVKLISARE